MSKRKKKVPEKIYKDNRPADVQYTFFRLDFKDWGEEFDYTIVERIEDIAQYLRMAEIHLDDPERKTKITITGVAMTVAQWEKWVQQTLENQ